MVHVSSKPFFFKFQSLVTIDHYCFFSLSKTLLDVGCGLGEASVYFAMEGACVTSLDISKSMLDSVAKTTQFAKANARLNCGRNPKMRWTESG